MKKVLCRLEDINEPGARSFEFDEGKDEIEFFVIRWKGELRAYLNRCPHTGVTLNWAENQFFDLQNEYIQCSLHGALFEPLSGKCIWGPCVGGQLPELHVEVTSTQMVQVDKPE